MSGRQSGRVTVVVAAIDAKATVRASLERFAEEVRGRGEVVLVDSSRDGTADEAGSAMIPDVSILRRPPGRLAPELWRDGLDRSDTPLVAFSNAQMVPSVGWLDALVGRLEATGAAAVGGPIAPRPRLGPLDRAVYLLRYVHYLRPLPDRGEVEPPGDNALYVRESLVGLEPLWVPGFWETEVHHALRIRGAVLAFADEATVCYEGGARPGPMAGQRYRHARQYGAQRGARMAVAERLARTASTPAIPCVMLGRVVKALVERKQTLGPWLPALPWLAVLLAAWTAGEARGVWLGPPPARAVAA